MDASPTRLPAYDPAAPLAGHRYRIYVGDPLIVVAVAGDTVTHRPAGGDPRAQSTVTLAGWLALSPIRTS